MPFSKTPIGPQSSGTGLSPVDRAKLDGAVQHSDLSAVPDGAVPLYNSATGTFGDSGIKKFVDDTGSTVLSLPDGTAIEPASINVGERLSLGESGTFISNTNRFNGKSYFVMDYLVDPVNGSSTPVMMDVTGQQPNLVQPQFGSIITGTSISAVYTSSQMELITEVAFKVASNMTNVRLRVVDVATGRAFKYWPNKPAWFSDTGESWAAGDHPIDLTKSKIQIPSAGVQIRVDIKADAISLRGNAGIPYLAIKTQTGQFTNMATQPWAISRIAADIMAALATSYNPLDSTKPLTGATAEARILAAISQAQATRRQVGTWAASTNTPTLTDPPSTFNGTALQVGDYVTVSSAGSRFGITWAVGDVAKVVLNNSGALAWYKDPVQNDTFDSKYVWASQAVGSDANSGSLYRPKQTIAGALAVVAQPGTVNLTAGSYTMGAVTVNKQNVSIGGTGVNANNSVELVGSIKTAQPRLRLRNVQITSGVAAACTWDDAGGSHHLQDVSLPSNNVGPGFVATANARGFATLAGCDFTGSLAAETVLLNDLPAVAAATTYLTNVSGLRLSVGVGHTVYVLACPGMQLVRNAGNVIMLDNFNVNGFLTSQAQLTSLINDTNVATDGYYICDFASPSVGARYDILLKLSVQGVATSVKVHREYKSCPASVAVWTGSSFDAFVKKGGAWAAAASAAGAGIPSVTLAQRAAITTAQTVYNTSTKMLESYDGAGNWKPLTPVNIAALDPAAVINPGIYVIQSGVPASLPAVVQNGVINQGDVFYYDGTNYWLLYTWANAPAAIYINQALFSGGGQYQSLLKSNSASNWYMPNNRTTDTGIMYVTKVTPAMGNPAAPYQMLPGDNVVDMDNSGPVASRLPPINTIAIATLTHGYTIRCPRPMSPQTAVLFTSGADTIVGGPMGHPNGVNEIYMTPGDSITLLPSVDPVVGNQWVIQSYTAYEAGASYYRGTLSSSIVLTSWGGYWLVNAASGDLNLVMPLSNFGKPGSNLKLIRIDTNLAATVTLTGPSGYTLNGSASKFLSVGGSVVVSTHTSGNTALRCEFSATQPVPVRCALTAGGASVTITSIWGFQGCPFSSALTDFYKSDPYGMHNQATPTRVYAPTPGLYRLSGSYRLDNTSGGRLVGIRYFKNGVATKQEFFQPVVESVILQVDFTANMYLAAGDYVEMGIYADIFKTLNVWYANFSVELLG